MTYKSFIKGALVVLVALTMSGCFVNLITQEYKDSLHQLSSLYEENKDEWINTIVSHCKEI